jgi:hypothetical protein
MRLRRRGTSYSLHDRYADYRALRSPPVKFRTLKETERWLAKYMDDEIARLGAVQ